MCKACALGGIRDSESHKVITAENGQKIFQAKAYFSKEAYA